MFVWTKQNGWVEIDPAIVPWNVGWNVFRTKFHFMAWPVEQHKEYLN